MAMRPRIITVGMSPKISTELDYGWKHLVACGCFSSVIILDPETVRVVQSLQVKWAPENYYHDQKNPYHLRLCSADKTGAIVIWDVVTANVLSQFSEIGCHVLALQWIEQQNISRDLLLALHSNGNFILWNTLTRDKLWKASISEKFCHFSFDPYVMTNIIYNFCVTTPLSGTEKTVEFSSIRNRANFSYNVFTVSAEVPNIAGAKSSSGSESMEAMAFSYLSIDANTTFQERSQYLVNSGCLQVCYHGYRKKCAILVYKHEIVIVSLVLLRPIGYIPLPGRLSLFSRVYSCRQRDVIICLHETGVLSVFACRGLAQQQPEKQSRPARRPSPSGDRDSQSESAGSADDQQLYELVAMTEMMGCRPRYSYPYRLAVDKMREVSIAVTSTGGRIQFWQLCRKPLPEVVGGGSTENPIPCLYDLLPCEPVDSKEQPMLYLRMQSLYTASKLEPTVCSVCPSHLLKVFGPILGVRSLVAVGNTTGGVQIWDMHTGLLWRELQVLPTAVLGIDWLRTSSEPSWHQTGDDGTESDWFESGEADSSSRRTEMPPTSVHSHLGLVVHGWQSRDRLPISAASTTSSAIAQQLSSAPASGSPNTGASSSGAQASGPPPAESRLEGMNHVFLVNLVTGVMTDVRDAGALSPDWAPFRSPSLRPANVNRNIAGSSSSTAPAAIVSEAGMKSDVAMALEPPVHIASVSPSNNVLALLLWGESVEFWSLRDLTLLKRLRFPYPGSIVALDWYKTGQESDEKQSPNDVFRSQRPRQPTTSQADNGPFEPLGLSTSGHVRRESCILCTSQGQLRLAVVDGTNIDCSLISSAVLYGLPAQSLERVSAVAWLGDLLALGTSDGYVVVRDLNVPETNVKMTSAAGWPSAGTVGQGEPTVDLNSAVNALAYLSATVAAGAARNLAASTGVRRLLFSPPGASAAGVQLMALTHDQLFILQSCDMSLVCHARYDGQMQRCLLAAAWASSPALSAPAPATCNLLCLLVGADGALRLAQMVQTVAARSISSPPASTVSTSVLGPAAAQFIGNSPVSDAVEPADVVLVPSLLANKAALIVRYLLQHQPWRTRRDKATVQGSNDHCPTGVEPSGASKQVKENHRDPESQDTSAEDSGRSAYALVCPTLAPGYDRIQRSVNVFLLGVQNRRVLARAFTQPSVSIVDRCLWTSLLFGDSYDTRFWRLVASCMPSVNSTIITDRQHCSTPRGDGDSPPSLPSWSVTDPRRLDLSWDLLADNRLYRHATFAYLRLLEGHRSIDPRLTRKCIRYFLLLGKHDHAISLLLGTPPTSPNYLFNMYRACLLAAHKSTTACEAGTPVASELPSTAGDPPPPSFPFMASCADGQQATGASTVAGTGASTNAAGSSDSIYLGTAKLVATELLSNEHLDDGIELLCLIGLYPDACRYLEFFDKWEDSVRMAKCMLSAEEMKLVFRRWASYLSSVQINQRDSAVLAYILTGDYTMALKLLSSLGHHQLAARFLEACLEANVIERNEETESLCCTVFANFTNVLIKFGHSESAYYYHKLSGSLGKSLKNEIDFLLAK